MDNHTHDKMSASGQVPAAKSPGWDFQRQPEIRGLVTWEWDIPSNYVYFSPEWREILGRPDDETVQDCLPSWWPLVHEDDIAPFVKVAQDVVAGKTEHYQTLFRVQRKDETWVWLLSRGRVTEWKDGEPVRVNGSLIDISFLRSDVKFQHGSGSLTEQGRIMRQNTPDLAIRMDEDLTPFYLNPDAFSSMHVKRTDVKLYGGNSPDLDPERMAFLRHRVSQVFREGKSIREKVTFPTAYGHDVTGEYAFWPEYDVDGTIVAVMTQFRDLTEVVLAQRRARLNEMRLDAQYRLTQMDNAPEEEVLRFVIESLVRLTESKSGVIFFPSNLPSRSGLVLWSGDHAESLGGSLPDNELPRDMAFMITGAKDKPDRLIQNGNNLKPLATLFDGRVPVLRRISAPIFEGERIVAIAMAYNKSREYTQSDLQQLEAFVTSAWFILRRHEFVRELHRAKEIAEKANKIKDEFLANVSHELRTPLNGMLSMLNLLDFLPLTDQQRAYVRTANVSGQALLRIISDILDFSRIESGNMQLRQEVFNFTEAVRSSLELFRKPAEEKRLAFSMHLDPDIPAGLIGDDARIRQIIFNIVGNALKFTEQGGIRTECWLLRRRREHEVNVYLSVTDTGIGIDETMLSLIFEAFTQIDSPSSRKCQGTGLGLSIVRRLVDLMGGSMSIESEAGKGTTIHCCLRFALPQELEGPPVPVEQAVEPSPMVLDILVAEDDPVARYAMEMFLKRAGHRPVCVENGKQALEALRIYPFHCLFTDVRMPEIDGLETVRRIRALETGGITPSAATLALVRNMIPSGEMELRPVPRNLIIVTISAHAMSGDRERFLKRGMDFYLSKPIIMKELQHVLDQIMARLLQDRD